MSSSYGQLQRQYNTLLALQLGQNNSSSLTLQQVLTNDNVATLPIILGDPAAVYSELNAISLTIRDALSRLTTFDENGIFIQNTLGIARYESYYLEYTGGMSLIAGAIDLQLINPIGNLDLTGLTVSINGVNYSPTYSGISAILPAASTGRIIFSATPLAYIPTVLISQVSGGDIIGLCITDITLFDFGFKATSIGIGSIAWFVK